MAACSISKTEFADQANIFFSLSVKNNDTWELKSSAYDESEVYLCKKCQVAMEYWKPPKQDQDPRDTKSEIDSSHIEEESFEESDESCLTVAVDSKPVCQFEYHIVYSASYEVPVLYFNAYTEGGSLLSLVQLWGNVPRHYRDRLEGERWSILTQQEHPILGRPFFQLHPCHTAELMSQLPAEVVKTSYLVTWLSAVGPVVGLKLPLSYARG